MATEDAKFLSSDCDIMNKDILIIGAGIAGLSCAAQLNKLGFHNVKVLEARDRVGGRMHTINHGDKTLELGAQWIHGEEGNVIHELAVENDIIDTDAPDYMKSMYEFPNVSSEEKTAYVKALSYLHDDMEELLINSDDSSDTCEVLAKRLQEDEHFGHETDMKSFFKWQSNFLCEMIGCESLDSVSYSLLHTFRDLPGRHAVELKSGYVDVLNLVLICVPHHWIFLRKTALKIDWSGYGINENENLPSSSSEMTNLPTQRPVKVTCEDGSIFFADHIIVTIPLGCLKLHRYHMFTPSLPFEKILSIRSLGFGTINKIYLEFDEPFWQPTDIFQVICDFSEMFEIKDPKEDGNVAWYTYINRFAYVPHQPNILCAWVTGKGATCIEILPNEDIARDCVNLLQILLRKPNLPFPCNIIKSAWNKDRFSKGSYSFLTRESLSLNLTHMNLSEPLYSHSSGQEHLALQFAGEATHPQFYGTVHGAYETGIREANRIHSFYFPDESITPPLGCMKPIDCVIIGAGVAGLACAANLFTRTDNRHLVILEALDRAGGRVRTELHGSFVLELGAQWIHGEDGNAVYKYCEEKGLIDKNRELTEGKGIFCTSSGTIVPESVVDEVTMKISTIKEKVSSRDYKHGVHPRSIVDVFREEFIAYMIACGDTPEAKSIKWALFQWFLRFEVIDNACENLNDIDTFGYAEWCESPGSYYNNVKKGFYSFIESLSPYVPMHSVHKSKPVKCIYWKSEQSCDANTLPQDPGPVVVECYNGDFYCGKTVVITSSAGFLKANMDTFFQPNLPEEKREALSKIGFGTINKIYLEFPKAFWENDTLGFQLLWLDGSSAFDKFSMPETDWVTGISGFDRVRGQPNMLVAWIGGSQAKDVEGMSDDIVGRTCVAVLKEFLQRDDIPLPIKVIRSFWYTNPYMKGAFSYRPSEFYSSGCTISDLEKPLETTFTVKNCSIKVPTVFFAGEAMSKSHFGTVHGAYKTGFDVAKEVVKSLTAMSILENDGNT